MTVLSRSVVNPRMMSIQCDVCCPPTLATNDAGVLRRSGWTTRDDGADLDACPSCTRERSWARGPLRRDRRPEPGQPEGRVPNLFLIGAAKCGTTSLHAYLDTHPEVAMAPWKEVRFFQDPDCWDWLDVYKTQFDATATVTGESSTMYTRAPALPGVAERIAKAAPDARLVYMVRDPVQRAVASYLEERFQLFEPRPVEEAFADLDDPYNPYVAASRYAEQLGLFLEYFPRERVLVLPLAELDARPGDAMARVFEFLGVDASHDVDTTRRLNEGSQKYEYGGVASRLRRGVVGRTVRRLPRGLREGLQARARRTLSRPLERPELTPELEQRLREALAPDAARFRELAGLELADWSV